MNDIIVVPPGTLLSALIAAILQSKLAAGA